MWLMVATAAALLAAAGFPPVAASSDLNACDAMVRAKPQEYASYHCYWTAARRTGQLQTAAERLEAVLRREPGNYLALLALARIERDRGRLGAEDLFRRAAAGFAAARRVGGEVYSRLELSFMLRMAGRIEEAAAEAALARQAAEAAPDPRFLVNVRVEEAWLACGRHDLGVALEGFLQLQADLAESGDDYLKGATASGLGATLWAMGRYADSLATYEQIARRHREAGDLFAEAAERYNVALLAREVQREGAGTDAEGHRLQDEALAAALRGGNRSAEASSRILIAENPDLSLLVRLAEAERALAIAKEDHQFDNTCDALQALATLKLESAPGETAGAYAAAAEAERIAREHASLLQTARALALRTDLQWRTGTTDEAFAAALAALGAIEKIRDLQRDELVRARTIAEWTYFYHRVVARLLGRGTADDVALERGFAVMERLRGRVLLDALDAAGAAGAAARQGPDVALRGDVLDRIGEVQRSLLHPGMPAAARAEALAKLDRLEAREAALRGVLARADPSFAKLHQPEVPTLAGVRQALADDQALLAFVVARGDAASPILPAAHGSWLYVVTRGSVRLYPVPDHEALAPAIALFLGLIERRDSSELAGAARLYRELLADAIDDLPGGIRCLVIIPDEGLLRLPFATLRQSPNERPLGARFEISIAPSAALWLRWRTRPGLAASAPAIALADPEIDPVDAAPALLRQRSISGSNGHIGPLPNARREARALIRALGGGSRLIVGRDASETVLKSTDLGRFAVLHLGAHALIDDEHPGRSAIVLARGGPQEDGLLQARDIVRLDLEGRLVVLSACRSGGGALLRGEGVMSLARAFFQAGAQAVVASQWPIRDDEAASFVTAFYRRLGRGASAAAALAAEQRAAIAGGQPAAAWASFALWGNGDLVPFPGGRPMASFGTWLAAAAAVLIVATVLIVARRRRLG